MIKVTWDREHNMLKILMKRVMFVYPHGKDIKVRIKEGFIQSIIFVIFVAGWLRIYELIEGWVA
jgi:hypothetical protein